MRTIYKKKLVIADSQMVVIPKGSKILHLGVQYGGVCMWYECDPDEPNIEVEIQCYGTGHNLPDDKIEYLGTVLLYGGDLVLHFYKKMSYAETKE